MATEEQLPNNHKPIGPRLTGPSYTEINQVTLELLQIGENAMAEVDTLMLSQEHSDIRREAVAHTNEIVKEGLKGDYETQNQIRDASDAIIGLTGSQTNTLLDRFFNVGRDTMDLRAQVTGLGYQVRDGFAAAAKDSEIVALKTQLYISEDGERTRALILSQNDASLNRQLIERNADLVAERDHARHWRGHYDNAQFQALTTQLNSFQSQLAETRQGMVNFGTMAGVGQTSTANNVR